MLEVAIYCSFTDQSLKADHCIAGFLIKYVGVTSENLAFFIMILLFGFS